MAEPARQEDEQIYDQPGNTPSRPQLRALEGSSQTTPPTGDLRAVPKSPQDLKNKEENPSDSTAAVDTGGESTHENQVGRGWRENDKPSKFRTRLLGTRRRKFIFGAGGIGTIGGLLLFLTLASGPAQLVQLSQILQNPFSKNNSDSSNRLGHLYRYAKTGNIGETRVGLLGSKIFGSTIDQLGDIGVGIETNPATGSPTRTTFDTDELKTAFPELEGMSDADAKAFIAGELGSTISPDQIQGSDGKFYIDQTGFDLKTSRLLTKSTVGLLDDGKIVGGLKVRELNKFFGIPSLFHPFSRIAADKLNSLTAAAQKKALDQQEQQSEDAVTEGVEAQGSEAIDNIEEGEGANKGLTGALTFTGGACVVYSTAGDIITANRDLVVLPAALMAVNIIAAGSQVMAGQDLSSSQVGALLDNLNQGGKTVWQGQALDALSKGGATDKSLTDLPSDDKTAFSGDTTASSIQSTADSAIRTATGGVIGAGGTFGACGILGTGVQIAITIGSAAVDTFQEVASGGTLTPAVATELAGLLAAKETLNFGETAVLLHYIQSFILNQSTAKLAAGAFSGPVGGDLLAYGARSAANISAIASGGISLGNQASTLLAENEQQQSEQQFKSTSLANRLFNPDDYQSVVGKLMDNISPSFTGNLAKMGSMLFHFGNIFSSFGQILSPKAAAAATPYSWGFPQYGLPDSLLNDPNLANPYANAQYVATNILNPGAPDANDTHGMSYIQKAMDCFGVTISNQNSDNVWDVIPTTDVNPSSDTYINGNCNDTDENWHRVTMFVFDTTTIKAAACYQGDDQSCSDIGVDSVDTSDTSTTTGSTTTPNVSSISINNQSAQQVAQASGAKVGYALYDSSGNLLASYNDTAENYGASITKAMILVAYLNQVGSNALSSYATTNLTGMIEQSNDQDANDVYSLLNNPESQINAVAQQAGMQGFKLNTEGDRVYYIGQSQITAQDFAKFFSKIDTMFPASQKSFALGLLSNISQQTGLLQAGLPGVVYSKEGWKPEPGTVDDSARSGSADPFGMEGAPYIVNQAAQFSVGGTTYGLAVTVGGAADQSSGEAIIQKVVSALIQTQ